MYKLLEQQSHLRLIFFVIIDHYLPDFHLDLFSLILGLQREENHAHISDLNTFEPPVTKTRRSSVKKKKRKRQRVYTPKNLHVENFFFRSSLMRERKNTFFWIFILLCIFVHVALFPPLLGDFPFLSLRRVRLGGGFS